MRGSCCQKCPPSASFDHFWHMADIFKEICQCGQISMCIPSIKCASIDGRSINNYSESSPVIDDRRAKNALFLFLMPSLPDQQQHTWEILHWHGGGFHDLMIISCRLTQMVFWEGWQQGFLWLMPPMKKARQKTCQVTIARSAPRLSRFGFFGVLLPRQEVEI